MQEKVTILQNGILTAEIRLPGSEPVSERFDSAGVVQQVILHGKHRFGQPEQYIPERVTCWGVGLCAEYDMDAIGREAKVWEPFPKPGIGLLTQIEDGKPYDMWRHYEIERFPVTWEQGEDRITFREAPLPCRGIALEIERALRLEENCIVLRTTVKNVGERWAIFSEYQHNFVAIDDLPVGEGYSLELPFDGTLGALPSRCRSLPDFQPTAPFIRVEGQTAYWQGRVQNQTWHKVTERSDIRLEAPWQWVLRHTESDASVSETVDFPPQKVVLWGVEHCICTEVYHTIDLAPGAEDTYVRTWRFEDGETRKTT